MREERDGVGIPLKKPVGPQLRSVFSNPSLPASFPANRSLKRPRTPDARSAVSLGGRWRRPSLAKEGLFGFWVLFLTISPVSKPLMISETRIFEVAEEASCV
jgi:hypothetical protein